jgi:Cu/Ag efflux protein CusF
MKLAKMVLVGAMLTVIAPTATAQQPLTGMVSTIDRISGTVGIKQTQSGAVGASTGGAIERQYEAADGLLEKLHAGDQVTFTVSESGGKKTITKIENK